MRWAVTLAVVVAAFPADAGCRLSPADCIVLYRAMTDEAIAEAGDERSFRPAGLSRSERGAALEKRHLDRIDERSLQLPNRIGNEWMRLEACSDVKTAAATCD
jgi:hypothetical protein